MVMREIQPTVIVDTREQRPLDVRAYPVEVAKLDVGDYGIEGFSDWNNPGFITERKSIPDLVGSLTTGRERFFREVEGMRRFRFAAILIEAKREDVATHNYRSMANATSILASLDVLAVRCGIHVFWCGDPTGAARQIESLVRQFVRGIEKDYRRLLRAAEQPAEAEATADVA